MCGHWRSQGSQSANQPIRLYMHPAGVLMGLSRSRQRILHGLMGIENYFYLSFIYLFWCNDSIQNKSGTNSHAKKYDKIYTIHWVMYHTVHCNKQKRSKNKTFLWTNKWWWWWWWKRGEETKEKWKRTEGWERDGGRRGGNGTGVALLLQVIDPPVCVCVFVYLICSLT